MSMILVLDPGGWGILRLLGSSFLLWLEGGSGILRSTFAKKLNPLLHLKKDVNSSWCLKKLTPPPYLWRPKEIKPFSCKNLLIRLIMTFLNEGPCSIRPSITAICEETNDSRDTKLLYKHLYRLCTGLSDFGPNGPIMGPARPKWWKTLLSAFRAECITVESTNFIFNIFRWSPDALLILGRFGPIWPKCLWDRKLGHLSLFTKFCNSCVWLCILSLLGHKQWKLSHKSWKLAHFHSQRWGVPYVRWRQNLIFLWKKFLATCRLLVYWYLYAYGVAP